MNVRANIDSDEGINHNLDQDAGLIPVPDKDTNQNPSTGDANMYIVFVAALMLAGSIVCLLAVNRKRCKEFEADKFRIL